MLWVHPDVWTLRELLAVYPEAELFDSESGCPVTYESIHETVMREHGREPIVDDIRWDRVFLQSSDGSIIPLSAAEVRLAEGIEELQRKYLQVLDELNALKARS